VRAFEYLRATDVRHAVTTAAAGPAAAYLAGGTTQVDLMKDGVLSPDVLIDIIGLPLRGVVPDGGLVRVGALTTMAELAADPLVARRLPVVEESLLLAASPQLRNMATVAGNLLQRTRCRYYRDLSCACNKREPGSGCGALDGHHRMHAILGTSQHCIATHASDLAVALVALDAAVRIRGSEGERTVPLAEFYLLPGGTPGVENTLGRGELITSVEVPLLPEGARSGYLKVRDRASYEFALASAAVALVALDTMVHVQGTTGTRAVPLTEFYLLPGDRPDRETVLAHGELITQVEIPLLPEGARSTYLKVRDRASYEFALASAAVTVVLQDGVIRQGRVGLGGVGTVPWRAWAAEEVLNGAPANDQTFRAAAQAAVQNPLTVPGTAFKVELAKRTLVRALRTVTGVTP
jgi:CO/xanthine dehydrogenase FAD-binding subunit